MNLYQMEFFGEVLKNVIGKDKMEKYKKSKALFEKYNYSHFHMARENENDYKQYKKYGISKKQENLWIRERLIKVTDNLNMCNNNSRITNHIEEICHMLYKMF